MNLDRIKSAISDYVFTEGVFSDPTYDNNVETLDIHGIEPAYDTDTAHRLAEKLWEQMHNEAAWAWSDYRDALDTGCDTFAEFTQGIDTVGIGYVEELAMQWCRNQLDA